MPFNADMASGSSFSVDSYPLSTTSSNKNVTNGTAVTRPRDCTGFCNLTSDNPEDLIVFVKDACGICVAQSTLLADIVEVNASTPNVTSKYKDCAGVCYSPGLYVYF